MPAPCIRLGEPRPVVVAPPGKHGWGYYQFPDMWRAASGEIYLCVNVGPDSALGKHEPSMWLKSKEDGLTWESVDQSNVDLSPDIHSLPDGREVRLGAERRVYHWSTYGSGCGAQRLRPRELGVESAWGPWFDEYSMAEVVGYCIGDFPEAQRRFPVAERSDAQAEWIDGSGTIDVPDLIYRTVVRGKTWFLKDRKDEWEERDPSILVPIPYQVAMLPDGTLLTAMAGQHPEVKDRRYDRVLCVESTDGGRIWTKRGTIADQIGLTTHGYGAGEQEIALMPDGSLTCVMRTLMCARKDGTSYLAAARSEDQGRTWSTPEAIAPFSVTPHIAVLENGLVAIIYGRPGVHVRVSGDSGRSWSAPDTAVGMVERELATISVDDWWPTFKKTQGGSCSNTDLVVIGPDRFLLAYSDFAYPHAPNDLRKTVLVREVIVGE